MIELVNGDEVITIPEYLTISMYQKLEKEKELYAQDPKQFICLFTGLNWNEVKNLSPEQVKLIQGFISTKVDFNKETPLVFNFTHNGVEYGLENDWTKLAWGAWIDFEVYSSENILDNIHKIMAVLYRPITNKNPKDHKDYTIEPYDSMTVEKRANEFLTLPITFWMSAANFFFHIVELYISNSKSSLEQKLKMKRLMMKGWRILPKWARRKLQPDFILR